MSGGEAGKQNGREARQEGKDRIEGMQKEKNEREERRQGEREKEEMEHPRRKSD